VGCDLHEAATTASGTEGYSLIHRTGDSAPVAGRRRTSAGLGQRPRYRQLPARGVCGLRIGEQRIADARGIPPLGLPSRSRSAATTRAPSAGSPTNAHPATMSPRPSAEVRITRTSVESSPSRNRASSRSRSPGRGRVSVIEMPIPLSDRSTTRPTSRSPGTIRSQIAAVRCAVAVNSIRSLARLPPSATTSVTSSCSAARFSDCTDASSTTTLTRCGMPSTTSRQPSAMPSATSSRGALARTSGPSAEIVHTSIAVPDSLTISIAEASTNSLATSARIAPP
jgi:hypothetical protein